MVQAIEKTTPSQVKVPPHNIEAEQAILAGILINNDSLNQIVDTLFSDDFYREAHMHLFEGMISLYNNNEPVDLITLSQYLTEKDLLEKTGGTDYLASLVDAVSTSAGIRFHGASGRGYAAARFFYAAADLRPRQRQGGGPCARRLHLLGQNNRLLRHIGNDLRPERASGSPADHDEPVDGQPEIGHSFQGKLIENGDTFHYRPGEMGETVYGIYPDEGAFPGFGKELGDECQAIRSDIPFHGDLVQIAEMRITGKHITEPRQGVSSCGYRGHETELPLQGMDAGVQPVLMVVKKRAGCSQQGPCRAGGENAIPDLHRAGTDAGAVLVVGAGHHDRTGGQAELRGGIGR